MGHSERVAIRVSRRRQPGIGVPADAFFESLARIRRRRGAAMFWGLLLGGSTGFGQVTGLTLSSSVTAPGTTTALTLSLASGTTAPAGLQWTFGYPSGQISSFIATAGPAATAAGKIVSCGPVPGSLVCVLAGSDASPMSSGIVANLQVTMAPNASTTVINVANPVAVSSAGSALSVQNVSGGMITVPVTVSALSCTPASVSGGQTASCTTTLSAPSAGGDTVVSLMSSNPLLTVPASVTVTSGNATAMFSATANASIPTNQSATVTATLGTSSQSTGISLLAPVLVSGVGCSPAMAGPSVTSICTVALTQSAPAGGVSVSLGSSNGLLSVPATIAVAAGSTTAMFNAVAAASIPNNQSATVTAMLGASSQTTAINLTAPLLVSGLGCNPTVLAAGGTTNCAVSLTQAVAGISLVHVTSCGPQGFPAVTCTIPATGSGNLIVVGWQSGSGVSTSVTLTGIADNAGNTYAEAGPALAVDTGAGSVADIWYAQNSAAGATTITISPSATVSNGNAVIWEFAGGDELSPVDAAAVLNSQPASTTAQGAIVTTSGQADVVVSLTTAGNVTGISPGSSFFPDAAVGNGGWAHLITGTAGTYGGQWNQSTAATYASSTAAFKAAGTVTLTSNNPLLTVPPSVIVPVGSNGGTFNATVSSSFASSQNATVTAALNSSSQGATVSLVAPILVSSFSCNATGLMSGGNATCSVALSQSVGIDTSVAVSSNSAMLPVPVSLLVPAGSASGSFSVTAGTITTTSQATVTVTLNGFSRNANLQLWPVPNLSSLICSPTKLQVGSVSNCNVALSSAAGNVVVQLSSSNSALVVPATVTVLQGNTSVAFTAVAQAQAVHSILLTAFYNGGKVNQSFMISGNGKTQSEPREGPGLLSMTCQPGASIRMCSVGFKLPPDSPTRNLLLSSSNISVKVPTAIPVQPNQTRVRFRLDTVLPIAETSTTITAKLGSATIDANVEIDPRSAPPIAPRRLYVKYGTLIRFQVSRPDPSATLGATGLPPGALFDSTSGLFEWLPDVASQGIRPVTFREVLPNGSSLTATSLIDVSSGSPVVDKVVNAASRSEEFACSPGAVVSLEGKWLADGQDSFDPTGSSTELAGTVVRVNGIEAPILAASGSRVDFVCPVVPAGTILKIALQTRDGSAPEIETVSREATPAIFSLDDSGWGQGVIVHSESATLVMEPNYQYTSHAAAGQDAITVYATGIPGSKGLQLLAGGIETEITSVVTSDAGAGIYKVSARLPLDVNNGDVPIELKYALRDGSIVSSNRVTLAKDQQ